MQKQFKIHSSTNSVLQLIITLGYMLILVSWLVPFLVQEPFAYYRPQFFRIAFYVSLTVIFMLYISRLAFASLRDTVFFLTDDSVIKRTPFKQTTIHFSEIISFRYFHAPFGFGFGLIRSHGKRIPLTFIINNLPGLVSGIHQALVNADKQSVFIETEVRAFMHHSRIAAFHFVHSTGILPSFLSCMFISLVINTFTALFIWTIPLLFSFIWIIISIIVPCIGFLAGYAIITQNISRQLTIAPETMPTYDVSGACMLTSFATLIVFLIAGILFKHNWIYLVR